MAWRLSVSTSNGFYYDRDRVLRLYEKLKPDPNIYGDDPAYAVWLYLHGSPFGDDVFEDRGDFDQWPDSDCEVDPDA